MEIRTSDQPWLEMGFGGYRCNWGMHMCGLYETGQERDDIILGFLAQGWRDGDLPLYCPAERTREAFVSDMSRACPQCGPHLSDTEAFHLLSPRDLYYPDGEFSPPRMDEGLKESYAASQAKGARNVRASSEMVWALEAAPGAEHPMVYESMLNCFIPGKPWISVCLYNVIKFSGRVIMDMLRTHPWTISKGVVTENPYYQDPDDWLSEYAPQFLPGA